MIKSDRQRILSPSRFQKVPVSKFKGFTDARRIETLKIALFLFSNRDVIRIGNRDEVQESGNDHELGAVVGGGKSDGALAPVLGQRNEIEGTRAHVSHKAQNVENVTAIRLVDAALHGEPQPE